MESKLETIDAGEWERKAGQRHPLFSGMWEEMLKDSFPYLSFSHYRYRDAFLVRITQAGTRPIVTPFTDVGDVVAIGSQELSLDAFTRDRGEAPLYIHSRYCPVDRAGEVKLVDYVVDLIAPDAMLSSLRKTTRHIIKESIPPADEVASTTNPDDITASYKLYLEQMRSVKNLVLPFQLFALLCRTHKLFLYKRRGEVTAMALFILGNNDAEYYLSAANKEGYEVHAPHHLLWHALVSLQEEGKQKMLLGATPKGGSLEIFKRGFRGREIPIIAQDEKRHSRRRSPLRSLWRLVPLSFLPPLSKKLGKHFF